MKMNYPLENFLLHIKICISVFPRPESVSRGRELSKMKVSVRAQLNGMNSFLLISNGIVLSVIQAGESLAKPAATTFHQVL